MLSFVLRHALGLIFVVSGVAKLSEPRATLAAVINFGTPRPVAPMVARSLPVAELVVATLLVFPGTSRVGGVAALALLVVFTMAVGLNLARGRRPDCNCFGRLGGADISGRTLVRNSALAAGALTVAALPTDPASAPLAGFLADLVLASAVLAVEAVTGRSAIRRRDAAAAAAFERAWTNDAAFGIAPDVALPDATGAKRTLAELSDGVRPILISFVAPTCGPCSLFKPSLLRWAQVYDSKARFVAITSGTVEENVSLIESDTNLVVLLDSGAARASFGVTGTPGAVLVGPDLRLAGPPAVGESNIRKLLAVALGDPRAHSDAGPEADAATIELASAPEPRQTVIVHEAGNGSHFLIDEATGATASLNNIASVIWQCLDGEARLDEIVVDLADAFGAPQEVVAADVLEFVRQVGRAGLLKGIAAELPDAEVDETRLTSA